MPPALRKRLSILPADRHRLALMIPVFFSLGMGEVLGISSSTSIFNIRYGVEHLPFMYVLEAVGLLIVSVIIADCSGKMERPRFLRGTYRMMAGFILLNGFILLFSRISSFELPTVYYPILLVSSMVIFLQLTPLIWLIATDICSTQQAKRIFPLLDGANTVGCITAGIVSNLLAPAGVEIIYFLWPLILLGGGHFLFTTIRYYISPLKSQDTEETTDLKSSINRIRHSHFLLSTLGLLTLIMTLYFLMDYQFNTTAQAFYKNEVQLAEFLALFLAASNVVALWIQLGFLNRMMTGLGNGNISLLVTAGLGFCFLIMLLPFYGSLALGAVFTSYLITEIMVNVIGAPSYQLLFKVIPAKERDSIRFLVEALVALGGMIGGAALSAFHSEHIITMRTMSGIGLLFAVIAFYTAWKSKTFYLKELIRCIANGVQGFREDGASLLGRFVPPGFLKQLLSLLHHPDDRKRSLALEIAEQLNPQALEPWIDDLLQDSCADVRKSALRCCSRLDKKHDQEAAILACCTDAIPEVRAAAIALLPSTDKGKEKLYEALTDSDPLVVAQAVMIICETEEPDSQPIITAVERCLEGGVPSAVIICQAIGAANLQEFAPRLIKLLDAVPGLRAAACETLGKLKCLKAMPKIISVYQEADLEFHKVADQALINMGKEAVPILTKELEIRRDLRSWLAIIKALSAIQASDALNAEMIESCLKQLNDLDLYHDFVLSLKQSGLSSLAELADLRCREIYSLLMEACWSVMASLYDPFVIARIKTASQESDIELRENSLEVLSEGLADRRLARAMLQAMDRQDPFDAKYDPDTAMRLIQKSKDCYDYWFSEIASAALAKLEGERAMEEQEMLSLLDKVMLLKALNLFSCLQLEELGLLARVARLEIYDEGTVLIKEGEPNSRLYIIIKGNIELSAHTGNAVNATLAVLSAGEAVGDTTVFDGAISPVTAETILDKVSLLTIDGQDLQRLCNLYPGIAAGFIRAISARVRKLEQLLAKMA